MHAAGIRSEIGFGQTEAANLFAGGEFRDPEVLLLLRAVAVDREHHQSRLHGGERAKTGIAAFELLHDQAVGDVVQPRAGANRHATAMDHTQLSSSYTCVCNRAPASARTRSPAPS